jgi:pimeloyl-ACP methyl ester carboxylesterase
LFTDADRTLLADGSYHTFTVETGTTTSTYADGTRPVSVGFFGLSQYQYGTRIKSNSAQTIPYLTIYTPPPPPPEYSNVLFLPGIEGSRLYEGLGCGLSVEEKLWEPIGSSLIRILRGAGDNKVTRLFLDVAGLSVCSDIYTKVDDIIDRAGGSNIYKTFIDEMNGLETDGTINDWRPVAYDWRLSLTDLLNKGAERGGKIYYEEATSTPYIEQTLRALAGSSQTGKVTIVAHSNGGLVAKALLAKLGDTETSALVDKIILVGAPQSGAPVALGALLLGHDQGITTYGIPILRSAIARALAINSPMAYHLLPSQNYFDSIAGDVVNPVARFAGSGYATERSAYGSMITNVSDLYKFIRADEGARVKPSASDVSSAEIGNSVLIDYANAQHSTLDSWTPPDGITVSQVAGWGVDTVSGISFYTLNSVREYRPTFVEDGDYVVTIPSALMMASSTSVKRYWVNLFSYNDDTDSKRTHRDLFEIPQLEDFINNIIQDSTSSLPAYISTSQPAPISGNKLSFFLHSPLNMQVTDSLGNVTGLSSDGYIDQNIPNSTYGELGDVAYIIVPEGATYQLSLVGQESGTFTLDMQESSGGVVTASSTIANVPTTASTTASLSITGGLNTVSSLSVNVNGDGSNIITISPILGETVVYEPPAPAPTPAPQTSSSGGGGGGSGAISFIHTATADSTTSTSSVQASSPQATTTVIKTIVTSAPVATVELSANASLAISEPVVKRTPETIEPEEVSADIQNEPIIYNVPQTASAYDASQQAGSGGISKVFYTALIGLFIISLLAFAVYKDHTAK